MKTSHSPITKRSFKCDSKDEQPENINNSLRGKSDYRSESNQAQNDANPASSDRFDFLWVDPQKLCLIYGYQKTANTGQSF